MSNLTKKTRGSNDPKHSGAHNEPPLTRIVVVRDDPTRLFRSVRPHDDTSRFGVRTGFWTAVTAGAIVLLWLSGHIGESLGFARVLGAPDLVSSTDHGLASGVRMALAAPMRVFEMAMADPMRLAAAFVLVSIPAASLSIARPRVPGGPKPTKLATTFAWLGLIAASLVWIMMVTWIALPARRAALSALPLDRSLFMSWSADLAATAGFDAFAFVASVLWLVLLFRLSLPRVATNFAGVVGFLATFVTWTGFATSNGIADAIKLKRPAVTVLGLDLTSSPSLLVGTIHGRTTVLTSGLDRNSITDGRGSPALMAIPAPEFLLGERQSIAEWLKPPK